MRREDKCLVSPGRNAKAISEAAARPAPTPQRRSWPPPRRLK
ncbi:MAG: hypothetical protein ACO2PN_26545 [Pyrobaculum sp.]